MPKTWHDYHSVIEIEDDTKREFYLSILADKKPYFMKYVYPALMKECRDYIKNTNKTALREFGMTVQDMQSLPELTSRQQEYLSYFEKRMPVSDGDSVMNRICHRIEEEFADILKQRKEQSSFDYSIYKSGAEYTKKQFKEVEKLYAAYRTQVQSFMAFAANERMSEEGIIYHLSEIEKSFRRYCSLICVDSKQMCDVVLDVCYHREGSKRFAWQIVGSDIISNLLKTNDYTMKYPLRAEDGEIQFNGVGFTIKELQLEELYEHNPE